jgi:hypothetical protein
VGMNPSSARNDLRRPASGLSGARLRGRKSVRQHHAPSSVARQCLLSWPDTVRTACAQGKDIRGGIWERLQDDEDLVRLKITLLVALVIFTAVLEWVT